MLNNYYAAFKREDEFLSISSFKSFLLLPIIRINFFIGLIREKDAFPFTMEMLGRWKVKTALPIIIERLKVDTIKTSAITALGNYKDTSLFSYVEPFLSSPKSGEKKAAQKAIERMNKECKQ